MGIIKNQADRADRFHFGFCNAFERSALETRAEILATPTKDAVITSEQHAHWVTAGVHACLTALDGDIDAAMRSAEAFGLSQGSRAGLRDMIVSSLEAHADAAADQDMFPAGA